MKRKAREDRRMENVVFKAALEPLEAAVLPAAERAPRGTLRAPARGGVRRAAVRERADAV